VWKPWPTVLVVAILAAANAGYTLWAMSSFPREDWVFYVDLEIPAPVAAQHNSTEMTGRLRTAGYSVSTEVVDGQTFVVIGAFPLESHYRGGVGGLDGAGAGFIWVDIKCTVWYFRTECGGNPEALLRTHLASLLRDAALPLDAQDGVSGDYDFAPAAWDGFWLWMGQFCLLGVSAMVGLLVLLFDLIVRRGSDRGHIPAQTKPFWR